MSTPYDDILNLRDRFAMAAMTGILVGNYWNNDLQLRTYALNAYTLADAMLKVREVKQ